MSVTISTSRRLDQQYLQAGVLVVRDCKVEQAYVSDYFSRQKGVCFVVGRKIGSQGKGIRARERADGTHPPVVMDYRT